MTSRDEYERFISEKAELALEIRAQLSETFREYSERAVLERRWEAASAFQLAADLALGCTYSHVQVRPVQVEDAKRAVAGRAALDALKAKVKVTP